MADSNFLRSSIFSKQPRLRVISHSRTISLIPKHQNNNISFVPEFLIKTLHRKKQHHRRCSATTFLGLFSPDISYSVPGFCGDRGKIGKTKIKNNPVMKLIQNPKSVGSKISNFLSSSSKKLSPVLSSERGKCLPSSFASWFRGKKRGLIKSVKGKTGSERSAEEGKPGNDKTEKNSTKRRSLSSIRSMITTRGRIEVKAAAMKIKGISRIMNKDKDEKRFELCKKKILMGDKCRPLDGNLRYDKKGVLIATDLT